MADDEDFLYGDGQHEEEDGDQQARPEGQNERDAEPAAQDEGEALENQGEGQHEDNGSVEEADKGEGGGDQNEEEDSEDEDDEEDGVQIVIDKEKIEDAVAKSSYQSFGLGSGKAGAGPRLPPEKKGKFNVEEFDRVGIINGKDAADTDTEALEDKPWRKPGADITDYFNYGFTEETWNAYCVRQRKMRTGESGAGMPGMGSITTKPLPGQSAIPTTGGLPPKRLPPPPSSGGHHRPPPDRGSSLPSSAAGDRPPAPIAVMTSDKRVYSKGGAPPVLDGMPDLSQPPPGFPPPGPLPPVATFDGPPPNPMGDFPADDPFGQEQYDARYGYEPTMESQWEAVPTGSRPPPPMGHEVPPGDPGYEDQRRRERDGWRERSSRSSREERYRDDDSRKRRRSRSRSRERYRRDRERRRSRDRDSGRDRERSGRDRSPRDSRSPSRHRKSKKERRDRSEVKQEIKQERADDE